MRPAALIAMAVAVIAGLSGCADAREQIPGPDPAIAISADKPPSPETWPKYPHFSQHSCWGRPVHEGPIVTPSGVAPSYAPIPRARPLAPTVVVDRLLTRLGDRRYVSSIRLTPAPSHGRGLYASGHPPADALQAKVVVRPVKVSRGNRKQFLAFQIAGYEAEIVGNALRDDFCDAGGAPLVMWESDRSGGIAERWSAVGQRFPNPPAAAFRKRVALVGRRFGFVVDSLRLLRPRQIAPLLIVKTSRSRKAFVKDIPRIEELLNPRRYSRNATSFEAFFFAVKDSRGPFAGTETFARNESGGGQWGANDCLFPYGPPDVGSTGANGPTCS